MHYEKEQFRLMQGVLEMPSGLQSVQQRHGDIKENELRLEPIFRLEQKAGPSGLG